MRALIDELKKPEYQGKTDQQAADMVNAKTVTIRQLVKVEDLKTFAMKEGFYPDIVIDAQSATDINKRKLS